MNIVLQTYSKSTRYQRSTSLSLVVAAAAVLVFFCPYAAHAQTYAVGQRTQCDGTGLKTHYQSGIVITPHPGETFNGYAAGSGYFYRVRIDGGDPDGTLCKAEDMRAVQAAAPVPEAVARRQAAAPAAPTRVAQVAPAGAMGSRFGTRDPRQCAPVRTKPNLEQITALVQCEYERIQSNLIYLDQNLSIQAGGTRPYSQFADGHSTGIDTNAPVIPIRGSADAYQCAVLSKYTNLGTVYDTDNTGRNCAISPVRQSTGTCYRTTFGDWQCHLYQVSDSSITKLNQPPPR
jgi:hypothetical protein